MTRNQFTLEDFRSSARTVQKARLDVQADEDAARTDDGRHADLGRAVGRGRSADEADRGDHRFDDDGRNGTIIKVIDASRKTRIASGSGSTISEVNQLLRQYEQMKKMMAQMNRGGLFGGLERK